MTKTARQARKLARKTVYNSPRGVRWFVREWIIPPGWIGMFNKGVLKVRCKLMKEEARRTWIKEPQSTVHFLRFGYAREFVVDVANIRNKVGFAYSLEQHQYRRYLDQVPEKRLALLEKFYEAFQPDSLADLLFVPKSLLESNVEVDRKGTTWFENPLAGPWSLSEMSPFIGLPWDPAPPTSMKERKEGTQYFGPYPEIKIRREAFRLENLLKSIEKFGYRPDLFDGEFGGHILTRCFRGERQAVFLPYEGSHRMAVLSHLGASSLRVKFDPSRPRECRIEDVKSFPGVEDGRFTIEQAETVFHSFFRDPHEVLIKDW